MFVDVDSPLAVGTEVWCELSIDGRPHRLQARVAWAHRDPAGRAVALGLQFCRIERDHAAALRSLVKAEAGPGTRARIRFEGLPDVIVGRTEQFEHSAVLRAALPFLELGRQVRIEVEDGERAGRVASIALTSEPDSAVPYLRIEFELSSAAPRPVEADVTEKVPRRARSRGRSIAIAAAMVIVGGVVLTTRARGDGEPSTAAATVEAPTPDAPAPEAPTRIVAPEVSHAPEAPVVPTVDAAPVTAQLAIRHGATTEIEIPLLGSTRDAEEYPLDDPPGLAINVPHAAVEFPLGETPVGRDGIRYVRVTQRRGGIQIRVHFMGKALPYRVVVGEQRITIAVTPG